eukprot:403852_1
MLGARGNLGLNLRRQRLDADGAAQNGGAEADGGNHVDVVAVAVEHGVVVDLDLDEEVSRGTVADTGLTLARHLEALTVVDTLGDRERLHCTVLDVTATTA